MTKLTQWFIVAPMHPPDLLSTRDTADRLGVSVATVARMAADGRLTPALRLDGLRGAMWFRPADVDALLARTEVAS